MTKKIKIELNYYQLIFLVLWSGIFLGILFWGWESVWRALAIPSLSPAFADMRTVQGALFSQASGLNPQDLNPSDPWRRVMNYPSVWIWLADWAGLENESNYLAVVSAMVLAFLVVCYRMLGRFPSSLFLLMCFSGASLLVVERGNNDVVVFALLYFAASSRAALSALAVVFSTMLKIYPVFSIAAFLRGRRRFLYMLALTPWVLLYLWPEVSAIRSGTPGSWMMSYGSQSVLYLAEALGETFQAGALSVGLVLTALAGLSVKPIRDSLSFREGTHLEERFFLIGSCIYLGTFLLASNWDYRMIFLLFCIPLLIKASSRSLRLGATTVLLLAANQFWVEEFLGRPGFYLNVFAKLALFVMLFAIALKLLYAMVLESYRRFGGMGFYDR